MAGNGRLTSLVGLVLLGLLAVEGATITSIQQLLSVHVFVGMLLLGPVALKLATTGYRFARYYTGGPEYVREGPPPPLMRVFVAPVLVLSTLTLFGSGVALLAVPHRGAVLGLHKASFIVWFGAMTIHVLAYTLRALKRVRSDLSGRRLPGRGLRVAASLLAVVAGAGLAVATYPLARPWFHSRFFVEREGARGIVAARTTASRAWHTPAAAHRPGLARAPVSRPSTRAAARLPPDRRPQQQPRAHRVARGEGRLDRTPRSAARTTRSSLPAGTRSSPTRSSTTRSRRSRSAGGTSSGATGMRRSRLVAGLPEHPRRRLPARQRRHDRCGHQELPDRRALPARLGRPGPRRQLRPRPAARVRKPERRHAAPRRRPARDRDRRLDRPPRRARPARLVGALARLVPLRRAALPNGRILVSSFTYPGRIVEMTPAGTVTWSFGDASGPNLLDKPSLAVRLPNGLIAANDDYGDRVILIDPRTHRIVWQYGHTGVPSSAPGYLSKPDGLDFLPARVVAASAPPRGSRRGRGVRHHGRKAPGPVSRVAAVALGGRRVMVLGGLVGGSSSTQILAGPPRAPPTGRHAAAPDP